MTPFGERVRELRKQRGIRLKDMARDLQISPAYLSALEHGHRGKPTKSLVIQICTYFNIIWEEAEDLERRAELSDPRVTVNTAGLSPRATLLANKLARHVGDLPEATIDAMLAILDAGIGVDDARRLEADARAS